MAVSRELPFKEEITTERSMDRQMTQTRKARFFLAPHTALDVLRADPAFARILAEGWSEIRHEIEQIGDQTWITVFFNRPVPALS